MTEGLSEPVRLAKNHLEEKSCKYAENSRGTISDRLLDCGMRETGPLTRSRNAARELFHQRHSLKTWKMYLPSGAKEEKMGVGDLQQP